MIGKRTNSKNNYKDKKDRKIKNTKEKTHTKEKRKEKAGLVKTPKK